MRRFIDEYDNIWTIEEIYLFFLADNGGYDDFETYLKNCMKENNGSLAELF